MKLHPADILTYVVFTWIIITLLLNFVIPITWYFQYDRLEADDVCSNEVHKVTGYYWAAWQLSGEGIDHVVSTETGNRKDRFEWEKGEYLKGTNQGSWNHKAILLPGEYRIENTLLRLNLFNIFPVYVGKDERPAPAEFRVLECE